MLSLSETQKRMTLKISNYGLYLPISLTVRSSEQSDSREWGIFFWWPHVSMSSIRHKTDPCHILPSFVGCQLSEQCVATQLSYWDYYSIYRSSAVIISSFMMRPKNKGEYSENPAPRQHFFVSLDYKDLDSLMPLRSKANISLDTMRILTRLHFMLNIFARVGKWITTKIGASLDLSRLFHLRHVLVFDRGASKMQITLIMGIPT